MVNGERIQYPYALDENENLVYIQDVLKETRHEHQYHCPECGKTMLPRLGEHNAKHFYHSENQKCGVESYIHSVAKRILAARFNDRSRPFEVSFRVHSICKKKDTCNFYLKELCEDDVTKEYDLHRSYDLPAREEVRLKYNSAIVFQPDVVLQSSKSEREPIYLEIWYKHQISSKKLLSKNHIIEIRVRSVSELAQLDTIRLRESENICFYNFKEIKVEPDSFRRCANGELSWGIRDVDAVLPVCLKSREGQREFQNLHRITLYESGKTFSQGIFEDEINRHHPAALADLTYKRDRVTEPDRLMPILIKRVPAASRTCFMCWHCMSDFDDTNRWCEYVKNGSIRNGTFKPNKASYCSLFECGYYPNHMEDEEFILTGLVEGDDFTIWVTPNG